MRVDLITLFPDICAGPLRESIIGRAQARGLVQIHCTDPRQFASDRHRTVDDTPYGGGAGMVLKADLIQQAVASVSSPEAQVILLTPQGERFTQRSAERLARNHRHLVLVCGHYEGMDERARQTLFDEEISIGDYVLTNGTIAAAVVVDAVVRLLPGTLGTDASAVDETFAQDNLLEYPQYTRPARLDGMAPPDVLLSGNHTRIQRWRQEQKLVRTASRRPDLLLPELETWT
ncbi:MAG: tRNA (guanosine(37)-N1)-methyltransferase TrmD [Lentisphaeria bacterium]|jgi:tRNA (guanine37-N1)-methyltransferase|nr:tRNA (guanosine(37)-N1)-methyltransferase TrmD [Lentisphaeria bacterium]